MDAKFIKKLSFWQERLPSGLLPTSLNALFISAVALIMMSGFQDYRHQLASALRYEEIADNKLKQPGPGERDLLVLQNNMRGIFSLQHSAATFVDDEQDYLLTANPATDTFYLSCPPAKISARVMGLLSGSNKGKDIAVIAYQGQERSYQVADALDKDINIVRILPDRAIVNMHGYCAALLLNY